MLMNRIVISLATQSANFLHGAVVVAADLCWFYASDLVRSFRTNLNESKRRGKEENIQRDDNSAGESVTRKYVCSVVELVPSLIMTHILGRMHARPTTAASANLSTSSECFTAPVRLVIVESAMNDAKHIARKSLIKVFYETPSAVKILLTQLGIIN